MRLRLTLATIALALLVAPAGAAFAVPLLPPLVPGAGDGVLPINDDGSSAAISLAAAFPGGLQFFGGPYTQMYVNNNGNISFNAGIYTYTPNPFPVASQPMIAPYWGDVDTRGGGAPTNNSVFWHLELGRMQITWHNVGYYNTHDDHKMDFQLIITNSVSCSAGDFDVEFRYSTCGWETGDASMGSGGFGGTPAQAGFDAGNGVDFVEIPGSRVGGISTLLCTTSNVGEPGIWRFSVHNGGIVCPGTGAPCAADGVGACSVGVTQCVGGGVVCAPIGVPSTERCDNIDNDCNGSVDDGSGLCSGFDICVAGACVPPCFEGGCADGYTCAASGACVETACIDVACPANERCAGGACVGACAGIVCPHSQQCIAGRCADLCDILTCGSGEICIDGACVPQCPCRACPAGDTCLADGSCESPGCDIRICDPGTYCEAGACLDSCAGAVCPNGQTCILGECSAIPEVDAGVPMPIDLGLPMDVDLGGTPPVDDLGITVDAGRRGAPRAASSACGCTVPGEGSTPTWMFWSLGLFGVVVARRRSRR